MEKYLPPPPSDLKQTSMIVLLKKFLLSFNQIFFIRFNYFFYGERKNRKNGHELIYQPPIFLAKKLNRKMTLNN
jgi:hypothetical protein